MHQIGLPPSYGSWSFLMHMHQTHRFDMDMPTFSLHGGDCIATHDVVQDSLASIAKDVGFHVSCKQTHVLSLPSF
jgi:hypothetical protein